MNTIMQLYRRFTRFQDSMAITLTGIIQALRKAAHTIGSVVYSMLVDEGS